MMTQKDSFEAIDKINIRSMEDDVTLCVGKTTDYFNRGKDYDSCWPMGKKLFMPTERPVVSGRYAFQDSAPKLCSMCFR